MPLRPYILYAFYFAAACCIEIPADELERVNDGWQDKSADDLFQYAFCLTALISRIASHCFLCLADGSRMYEYIFPNGNRNAASHLWATFVLDRAKQMTAAKLDYFFMSFCPVSGSPVMPDSTEQTWFYDSVLADLAGNLHSGFMVSSREDFCSWFTLPVV